jgi:hypothetical protein
MRVDEAVGAIRSQWPTADLVMSLRERPDARNHVWRVALEPSRTAVLKVAKVGTLAAERAALDRIGGWPAPRLLASAPGWLLVDDLGPGASMAPTALLAACGRALGRVHAATTGFGWEAPPVEVSQAAWRWPAALAGLGDVFAAVGVRWDARSARERDRAWRLLSRPGSARALTHGDAGPPNVVVRGADVWLIDWEAAGVRHRALDLFPIVAHWLRANPGPWPAEAESALLAAWSSEVGGGLDDGIPAAALAWGATALWPLRAGPQALAVPGRRARVFGALEETAERIGGTSPRLARDLARLRDTLEGA